MSGHPGGRRMNGTLKRDFYWPHIENDVYATVRICELCTRVKGTKHKHQSQLKLFPANGPLELVEMDIMEPLPKTEDSNQ